MAVILYLRSSSLPPSSIFFLPHLSYSTITVPRSTSLLSPPCCHCLGSRLLLHIFFITSLLLIALAVFPSKIDTFIKHYLRRTVTADTRAIVSGYEPQRDLMRAACRMTRWIDPDRPQELTPEESLSVNQDPVVCRLISEREKWKRRFQGTATQQPGYRIIGQAIFNTRQRLRAALLKYVQER